MVKVYNEKNMFGIRRIELNDKERVILKLDGSVSCPVCGNNHQAQETIGSSDFPRLHTFHCDDCEDGTVFVMENHLGEVTLFWKNSEYFKNEEEG